MKTSPLAGKPAPLGMLVAVPRLITAYYTEAPDSAVPAFHQQTADEAKEEWRNEGNPN